MSILVDIFSGFLGAGKTTLIKKLIDENFIKEKVAIIENEFGEVGIDGSILRKSNMQVKEINAGCICCTINQDFKEAVGEVIDKFNPSRIIIEPSGVGKLSEILKSLNSADLKSKIKLNMIIAVVDALKYKIYISNFDEFYKNQIVNSNAIILSRTQAAKTSQIEEVMRDITKINPKAAIITTPWDKISSSKIVEVSQMNRKIPVEEQVNLIKMPEKMTFLREKKDNHHDHHADEIFSTWGIETAKVFNKKNLIENLHHINKNKNYGIVLRAKGIVQVDKNQWIQFDYVPDEFKVVTTTPDYTGRLCIIGSNLNKKDIKELFLR